MNTIFQVAAFCKNVKIQFVERHLFLLRTTSITTKQKMRKMMAIGMNIIA